MIYKKDSLTSCLWEGTLYDMLKSAIRGHWDKIILDKSRASPKTGVVTEGNACGTIRSPYNVPILHLLPRRKRIATSLRSSQ